jgi:hypothetical protein
LKTIGYWCWENKISACSGQAWGLALASSTCWWERRLRFEQQHPKPNGPNGSQNRWGRLVIEKSKKSFDHAII